jgi:alkaline phosphatase D
VQKQFLLDSVKNSTSTWKLVGNQVVFMQWSYIAGLKAAGGPTGLNGDSWDAYTAERQSIIDNFRANSIKNVIICTGDVHCSWVGDITDDPNNASAYNPTNGTGSVCTEYVVTSVTSPAAEALAQVAAGIESFKGLNPHIKYIELTQKGYMLLDITPQRVQGEVYFVSTIATRGGSERFVTAFPTALDANRLSAAVTMPSTPVADAPALAP